MSTKSFERVLLKRAQELGLKLEGGFQTSDSRIERSSERASLMTEELALQQRGWNRRAVEHFRRPVSPLPLHHPWRRSAHGCPSARRRPFDTRPPLLGSRKGRTDETGGHGPAYWLQELPEAAAVSPKSRALMEDEQTFLDCVNTHAPSLRRFARRLTRNDADAEDVMQETLLRALEKRDQLKEPERIRAWLLTIVRTSWFNSRRGLRNKLEVLEGGRSPQAVPAARGDLEREILDRSFTDDLLRALEALPAEWRETLWLREVEDLSYDEIAAALDCPLGTVRSRLARARAAAAAWLAKGETHGM